MSISIMNRKWVSALITVVIFAAVILFYDVGHQTEIVLNEGVARLRFSGTAALHIGGLLFGRKGAGKGTGVFPEPQSKKGALDKKHEYA